MTGRTSLTPFAPAMRDLYPDGWRTFAANLWYERGMVVIGPGQLRSWEDQELVERIAAKLYGKRELKDG